MVENPDEEAAGFDGKIDDETETGKNRISVTKPDAGYDETLPDRGSSDSSFDEDGVSAILGDGFFDGQSPYDIFDDKQWFENIDASPNFEEYGIDNRAVLHADVLASTSLDPDATYPANADTDEDYLEDGFRQSDENYESQKMESIIDPGAVEAILMVATEPVLPSLLAELLETTTEAVDEVCDRLAREYETSGRGFELVKIAGGYRYQSVANYRDYVERFIIQDMPQKLSPAAMETLAIIAYKQPISRAQIATIRGVNVDRVVRVLIQKGLIQEVAKDSGPGQAILFGTTAIFLERLGLNEINDLPPLEEYVPDVATVEALEHVLRDKP